MTAQNEELKQQISQGELRKRRGQKFNKMSKESLQPVENEQHIPAS